MTVEDDTSSFNNEPDEDESVAKPRKRARAEEPNESKARGRRARTVAAGTAYDATKDPTAVAIMTFLTQSPAAPITRNADVTIDGTTVAIGNMMYTLRRSAHKEDNTQLHQDRLRYLSTNDRWLEFVKLAKPSTGASRSFSAAPLRDAVALIAGSSDGEDGLQMEVAKLLQETDPLADADATADASAATIKPTTGLYKSGRGLQEDIDKLTRACLQMRHLNSIRKMDVACLYYVVWQSFPSLRSFLTQRLCQAKDKLLF